jgi:hypothetical protein
MLSVELRRCSRWSCASSKRSATCSVGGPAAPARAHSLHDALCLVAPAAQETARTTTRVAYEAPGYTGSTRLISPDRLLVRWTRLWEDYSVAAPPPPSTLSDDLRSCATVVLVLLVVCILLANVAVTAPPTGCLNCGPLPAVPPPILTLVQTSPLLIRTLLGLSVLMAAIGIYAGRMKRRVLAAPCSTSSRFAPCSPWVSSGWLPCSRAFPRPALRSRCCPHVGWWRRRQLTGIYNDRGGIRITLYCHLGRRPLCSLAASPVDNGAQCLRLHCSVVRPESRIFPVSIPR